MRDGRQHITLSAQVEEALKAFALREREISGQVASGRIREAVGALHVARLRAARQTLLWLEKHESTIKAKVAGGQS